MSFFLASRVKQMFHSPFVCSIMSYSCFLDGPPGTCVVQFRVLCVMYLCS